MTSSNRPASSALLVLRDVVVALVLLVAAVVVLAGIGGGVGSVELVIVGALATAWVVVRARRRG